MIIYSINVCVTSLLTRNTKAFVLNKLISLITVTSEFKLLYLPYFTNEKITMGQ